MTRIQTDLELVEQFARGGSDDAFAELVSRHADWIYSAARRMVRDPDLAEDVTQAVFIVLAQKSKSLLGGHVSVSGWLFRVTRHSCSNALRARNRRAQHEREAAAMNSESAGRRDDQDHLWDAIEPSLDEVVEQLRPQDRDALLLRFYQRKSMADVGAALGVSEDAAKKRVARAVDNLRNLLGRKGVVASAGALIGPVLLAHTTTHAAPAALLATCAAVPGAAATAGVFTIAKGTVISMATAKAKMALIGGAIACLLPLGIGVGMLATGRFGGADSSPTTNATIAAPPQPPQQQLTTVAGGELIFTSIPIPSRTRPDDAQMVGRNRVRCGANLKSIGQALLIYGSRHGGSYPADLGTLATSIDIGLDVFLCPNSGTPKPNLSRQETAEWINANSDYGYIPGLTSSVTATTVLAFDKEANEYGDGMNMLFGDGHVEFVKLDKAQELIAQSLAVAAQRK